MLKNFHEKIRDVLKRRVEVLLVLFLISGCTVTVGTTGRDSAAPRQHAYHYVRRGENLFRISSYYYQAERTRDINEGVERIKRANGLVGEQLSEGQRLFIPDTTRKQPSHALLPPDTDTPAPVPPDTDTPAPVPSDKPPSLPESRPLIAQKAFIWPVEGRIISRFGELGNQGLDILVDPGTDVLATAEGRVVFAGETPKYKETVIIEHPDGIYTVYGHDLDILVKQGDTVKQGSVIGKIKSGTHRIRYLHFEIRIEGAAVNPALYLPELPR